MDFSAGSKVGHFILDEPIGSGSFGAVWRGHDERDRRTVAVKLLTGQLATAESAALRADVEVLAATAAARSPHVVGVLGGGSDPVPYIVMEFIEGTDLQERLTAQGRLSVQETIDVAMAIADAIRALYDAGIIHRDIKPANVLIDAAGVVKLADFGIAKIVGYMTLTMTGQTAMTMAYAAPELWDNTNALGGPSNKSDLYAMGVLLYQCLAGSLPFLGTYGALYRAHAEQPPDLKRLPPETPPSLRALIRQCLNKPPEDRPADAAACLAMLERATIEMLEASGRPTREPNRFGPWIRQALHETEPWTWSCRHEVTGEVASVEVHFADELEHANVLRRAVEANPRLVPLGAERLLGTNRLLLHPEEAWQAPPSGRFQFWVAREDAGPEAATALTLPVLRRAAANLALLIEASKDAKLTVLSPASQLKVQPDGSIYVTRPGIDATKAQQGETAMALLRRLAADNAARQMLAASPDFESLIASLGPPAATPGDATRVAIPPQEAATALAERPGQPAAVPDPARIHQTPPPAVPAHPQAPVQRPAASTPAVATQMPRAAQSGPPTIIGGAERRIAVGVPPHPPAGAKKRSPLPFFGGVVAIAAVAAGAYFFVLKEAETEPETLLSSDLPRAFVRMPPNNDYSDFDGIFFVSDRGGGGQSIWVANQDGSEPSRMTYDTGSQRLPDASPDGSKVAYVVELQDGSSELWIMDGDASTASKRKIVTTEGVKLEPNFSPDSRQIVFEVKRGENYEIYVINADGTGLRNLTNTPSADIDPGWSPDGTRIVFCSDRDGNMDLYVINADGTNARKVTANPAFEAEPDWGPDNKTIVFSSNRNGNFDLFIVNVDGTGLARLTTDPRDEFDPVWSRNGTKVAYTLVDGANSEVFLINTDGTNPRNITNSPGNDMKPSWTILNRIVPTGATRVPTTPTAPAR